MLFGRTKKKAKTKKKDFILLEDKINAFVNWYIINMVKEKYSNVGEYFEQKKIRYLIDKMTAWFELRYPENDLKDKLKLIDTNTLNDDFNSYLRKLSWDEKWIYYKREFSDVVVVGMPEITLYFRPCFWIDSKGFIYKAENISLLNDNNYQAKKEDFINKHIEDVYENLKKLNLPIDLTQIKNTIDKYKKINYMKEEFLNCVMYNIIERGGNRVGPRRGLIFAQEFNRNISVPMKYGVDLSDPNLREFIEAYLKLNGDIELECINGYFQRDSDNYEFETINLKELLKQEEYPKREKEQPKFMSTIQSKEKSSNKVKKLVK